MIVRRRGRTRRSGHVAVALALCFLFGVFVDPAWVVGKTTIAPLVKRFPAAACKGQSPSPSFEDGLRAQVVLDAVLDSIASGGRMVSI
jgi:hypothetical protein